MEYLFSALAVCALIYYAAALLAMRAFGRRAFPKTFDKKIRSYWVKVAMAADVGDYYRQF